MGKLTISTKSKKGINISHIKCELREIKKLTSVKLKHKKLNERITDIALYSDLASCIIGYIEKGVKAESFLIEQVMNLNKHLASTFDYKIDCYYFEEVAFFEDALSNDCDDSFGLDEMQFG